MTQENTALIIAIAEDAKGKLSIVPDMTIRTFIDPMAVYNPANFPRTEATNPRGWAEWGGYDNLPNIIDTRISSVPFAKQVLVRQAEELCGKGVALVKEKDFFEGNYIKTYHPEAVKFIQKNSINTQWLAPQAFAKKMFFNTFTQLDLDMSHQKVARMFHLDSMFCRLSKQDVNDFEIKYMKFCGKFGSQEMPADSDIKTLPLYRWYKEDFFEWLKGESYVFHGRSVNVGTTYYPRPTWIKMLDKDTWLDIAKNTPRGILKREENQARVKYHLKVSVDYFKFKHPDWDAYTAEKRLEITDAFEAKIESSLTGFENGGKMITTYHFEENGKLVGLIELIPIDDKFKNDEWIMSSTSANSEIINAFGYHASQMSMIGDNGKAMGGGSGSDARVHFNAGILRNTMQQMELLEPLNHVFQKNGYGVVAMIDDLGQTTTDQSKSGIVDNTDLKPQ